MKALNNFSAKGIVIIAALLFTHNLYSQPNLKPTIAPGPLPADPDSMCYLPIHNENTNSFDTVGAQLGDTIPDLTFYDINGDSMNINTLLMQGKAVMMVAGSYTCPVFRGKIADINDIAATYSNNIEVFVIYEVEAHPVSTPSPNSGNLGPGNANINEGILYEQPLTYAERKTIVNDMMSTSTFDVPIYLDGTCNEWWTYFGPAPNIAYVVDTNGVIVIKHGWFDRLPHNMRIDLDAYLGDTTGSGTIGANGTFDFILTSDTVVFGIPSEILYAYGEFQNNSADTVLIEVIRSENNMPTGWESSICIDICLSYTVDSAALYLNPGETQSYTQYIYSNNTEAQGDVLMTFRNAHDHNNVFNQRFVGITDGNLTGITNLNDLSESDINVFPTIIKTGSSIYVSLPSDQFHKPLNLTFYDLKGQVMFIFPGIDQTSHQIEIPALNPGLFVYQVEDAGQIVATGKLVVQP